LLSNVEGENVKRIACVTLIIATMLAGCTKGDTPLSTDENKSPDVTSVQNENKILQDQVTQLQAQLQAATEQKNEELQKATESNQDNHDPDMLAISIKLKTKEVSTNNMNWQGIPLLSAYIVAIHSSNLTYLDKGLVPKTDPGIAKYMGNVLEKHIKNPFIRIQFLEHFDFPLIAIKDGETNTNFTTDELIFIIDPVLKMPAFYIKVDSGMYRYFEYDTRGMPDYDSSKWVDLLNDYMNQFMHA
jgi:hypothetical protein